MMLGCGKLAPTTTVPDLREQVSQTSTLPHTQPTLMKETNTNQNTKNNKIYVYLVRTTSNPKPSLIPVPVLLSPNKLTLKTALSLLASPTIATATTQVPLPEGTKVLDVKVTGSVATVNFSKEIMKNPGVGAEGEALALCSIPLTAKQFGIEKVYVLIEGQKPSEANGYIDFWGHVGLYEQPLTASQCMKYIQK
jgi:spore germination protein GerM